MPTKSLVKIVLRKGGLPGYHIRDLMKNRRVILMNLLKDKKTTYAEMVARINVLAIYNKNKNPEMSAKFRRDIKYLQKHAAPLYSKSAVKRVPKKSTIKRAPKKSTVKRVPKKSAVKRVPKNAQLANPK